MRGGVSDDNEQVGFIPEVLPVTAIERLLSLIDEVLVQIQKRSSDVIDLFGFRVALDQLALTLLELVSIKIDRNKEESQLY